jgi:hypothetical protein
MAGTTTYQIERAQSNPSLQDKDKSEIHTFEIIADAADGSIASKASDKSIHGWITKVITDPGATAPTADYDLTLSDPDGVDVMGGELNDRSATVSEQAMPLVGSAYGPVRVDGILTLSGSNNSVNSAEVTVKVHVSKVCDV